MKFIRCISGAAAAFTLCASATAAETAAVEPRADSWQWRAAFYGWFPSLDATSNFAVPGGDSIRVEKNPGSYLRNLEFAFMGTLEARNGPWSVIGDAVYVDFGKGNSNLTTVHTPAGALDLPVPASAHTDLKAFVGALAAGYTVSQSPSGRVDVIGGARFLRLKASVDWEFETPVPGLPPQGSAARTKEIWDGIVGVRGAAELDRKWFVPYHVDAGSGRSRFTWQAFGGVGYHFEWGDVMAGYRYLAYDFRSEQPVSKMSFGGPIVGVAFRF